MSGFSSLTIVRNDDADELVRFAAEEIQRYVNRLAGFSPEVVGVEGWNPRTTTPIILLGSPTNNLLIAEALNDASWPGMSDQGFLLRKTSLRGQPAMIVGAESPVATMWAAYELVERWGVTFTPRGDVFASLPVELNLPDLDLLREPVIRVRGWRGLNCEVNGMEFWGLEDYRRLLGQLAKLKYNTFSVAIYPYGPWVDYQFHGVRKSTSELNFGLRYPLHDGMIGRELFGEAEEFTNPEFAGLTEHQEKHEAGKMLIHGIMQQAGRLGMKTGLFFCNPIEATNEFRLPFKEWTDFPDDPARDVDPKAAMYSLGRVLLGTDPNNTKHQNVEDPLVQEMGATVLKAHLDAYPELDYYFIWQSESRASATNFRRCWEHLDKKYDISSTADLDSLMEEASERGGEGAVRKLKADIEYLFLLDRLTNEMKVQAATNAPDANLYYGQLEEALFDVLAKVLGKTRRGFIAGMMQSYTKAGGDREDVRPFEAFAGSGVPVQLKWTAQTDMHAMLLQVRLSNLQGVIEGLRDTKAEGYQLCYWVLGDFVPAACYVAKASWDASLTADQFWQEFLEGIVGPDAVADATEAFGIIDEATGYEYWKLEVGFPMPRVFKSRFDAGEPQPRLVQKRKYYEDAIVLLRRAYQQATPTGRKFLEYYITRAEYTVRFLRCISTLEQAGASFKKLEDAKQRRDSQEYFQIYQQTLGMLDDALETIEEAARLHCGIVEDQCDRGTVVATNVYGIDYIRALRHLIQLDATDWHW